MLVSINGSYRSSDIHVNGSLFGGKHLKPSFLFIVTFLSWVDFCLAQLG
ncbi:hypothetical protein NC653_017295 [Populus alba x Populus x berolinensis]|uniref:Uncharacterized protein n=1 Tax=Populus alba x Populus x berolinensis TaxID=444605 RepID=A0AAD6QQ73_9ROSI|nr:hypothetical protein NC653_017295 [Populus alba x Populus x berolinensis]